MCVFGDFVSDIIELKCVVKEVILYYKVRFCVSLGFSQLFSISQGGGVFYWLLDD